jgi:hypothetical protein
LGPDHPPDAVGKLRAHDLRRKHSYPQLEAAQERRARAQRALLAGGIKAKKGDKQ